MRYLENESTYIFGQFDSADTVTITIYKASDASVIINAASCTHLANGIFKYLFSDSITTKTEYLYVMTNGIEEHAGKIILGGYPDSIKDETDKIQTGIIDAKNDYKANVSNLDVAVSTRNATTPPTVGEIRTEMEGAGSKILTIEGYTDKIDDTTNGLTAIKAEVEGLGGEAMRGTNNANTIVPPTTTEIKTELEGTGTKLTLIKDKTDTLDWTDITKILQIEQGKWKIENNQMKFFEADGVTPLLTFNLKDKTGQATETEVFERVPV